MPSEPGRQSKTSAEAPFTSYLSISIPAVGAFSELFARLDADPRVRGGQFEHVCKWFLTNDPTYKSTLRRVWLWKEWTGRWGGDSGIDLVAEDRDGRLWAIQAKAYDPANAVTKADVDKFLAESSRAVFSYRLLIATTDKLHHIARRTINDQEKQVAFVGLSDLLTSGVNWPTNPLDMRPSPPPKPAKPREHQREAIRDVVKGFTKSDRGQLIMACGTGKTLTSLFIREKLDAERVLVLVPSLSLLKQTMQVWRVNATVPFDALPVCSDETVGRSEEDAAVAHTSELGVPVTTDPADIAAFLRRRRGPLVVFSTYQSSPQIAAAFALGRVSAFDLVVADEAHRVAGLASSDFSTVLNGKAIKAKRRLFMTATPRYFTGRVLRAAQDADLEVASMDDEAKFGTVFHRLTFGEAIKRDLLTDYQVAVVGVDNDTYGDWAEKGILVTRDGKKTTDARTLAGQIGLAKAMRKYELHRTISFHSRVARAREFAAEMPEVIAWMPARQRPKGALWSSYASGEMTAGERHVRLQYLSRLGDGERGLLANARCLSEGVDVPTLDGVAFIDPRRSEVDIVQAVGRAIRKAQDKNVGTIVIPVFIDTNTDPATALDDSVFKPVWDVVQALRAHDEELGEQLDELRRSLGKRGGRLRLPGKIHLDLPTRVGLDFANAFDVRLVEQTTASWEFWFGLLEKYVADNGTSRVPFAHATDGHKLGQWINAQRNAYAAEALSADRQLRLESLPGWTWNARLELWEDGYDALCRYVDEHGNARVPYNYSAHGFKLGIWVTTQRRSYTAGKLELRREQRLSRLPGWTWAAVDEMWEEGFDHLCRFVKDNGSARVPSSHFDDDGYKLGQWVAYQRQFFKKGTLDPDRRQRLDSLAGWSWGPKIDTWEEKFLLVEDYVSQHGHARVPTPYEVNGVQLGWWVASQRSAASRGRLDQERYHRFDNLPGWAWNTFDSRWAEGFSRLLDYVEKEGTSLVPQSYKADVFGLGSWVNAQRHKRAKGELDEGKRRQLEALPGWSWDVADAKWESAFGCLQRYAQIHGNSEVAGGFTFEDYKLGDWVERQRSSYAKGKLTPDRIQRLEGVTGWQWTPKADKWERGFGELVRFAAHHGHANVPVAYAVGGYKLGGWVQTQRLAFDEVTIDPERKRRLEDVAGWTWNPHSDSWERAFRLLEQYAEANGNTRVPDSYRVGDFGLGAWVGIQRGLHRKGKLTAERVRRLE